MTELIFVYGLVALCALYVLLHLVPRPWKSGVAKRLLALSLPDKLRFSIEGFVNRQSGLGCAGCSNETPEKNSAVNHPLVFYRKNSHQINDK